MLVRLTSWGPVDEGSPVVFDASLFAEATVDPTSANRATLVRLTNGDSYWVEESVEQVQALVQEAQNESGSSSH